MSEENKVTTETVSEETTTETTQDSSNDGLIAESKKYRKRAQEAEARLSALEKKVDSAKQEELKKKEEWKTLYEEKAKEAEALSFNAEKWTSHEKNERARLLERHPEEEREKLSTLDLDTLTYLTEKINTTKPNAPEVVGRTKAISMDKPYDQMNEMERRAWFNEKMKVQEG